MDVQELLTFYVFSSNYFIIEFSIYTITYAGQKILRINLIFQPEYSISSFKTWNDQMQ
jgi:hypothetical protein